MIKRFQQHINEKLGISDAMHLYVSFLTDHIFDIYVEFFKSDLLEKKDSLIIPWSLIKSGITSDSYDNLYKTFPIKEFNIKLIFNKKYDFDDADIYTVGGGFYEFTDKPNKPKLSYVDLENDVIYPKLEVSVSTEGDLVSISDLPRIKVDIESTIAHELNHCYEDYNRVKLGNVKGKKAVASRMDTSLGTVNITNPDEKLISDDLFNRWSDFTYLLYYSEGHEINAVTQESLTYIRNNTKLDDIPGWKISGKLNSFKLDEYYDELLKLADNDVSKLELLKKSFVTKWKGLLVSLGRRVNNEFITNYNIAHDEKLNCYKFIKKYSLRIAKAGRRLKRNILRLYSYDDQKVHEELTNSRIGKTNLLTFKVGRIRNQIRLYKMTNGIYAIKIKDKFIRCHLFMRYAEFYETVSDDFRDKKVNINDFIKWYKAENNDDLYTYNYDWFGFNIPSTSIIKCFGTIDDRNEYDNIMESIVKTIQEENQGNFYLLGVDSVKGDLLDHEMAHGLYYTNTGYRTEMDNLTKSLPENLYEDLKDIITEMGYVEMVIPDEIQAYISTGLYETMEELENINSWIEKYKAVFHKYLDRSKPIPIKIKYIN